MSTTLLALCREIAVTISSGTSESGDITLQGYIPVAIAMPGAWTAASLTFQVAFGSRTGADLYDGTGEYTITTAAASRFIALEPAKFYGATGMIIRSGTSATPVNQASDRNFFLYAARQTGL